ncbi:MAG: DUF2330 domain-containing protein [Deltaproteobacteria bacterium]|nr:DUF2330 domain-containing protein [Deltaproteobacteria bacterium]
MKRLVIALAILAHAQAARAFCGFYVADSDQRLVNNATQVVLVRTGTRTTLAMQNDYQGPLKDFAMVVPVPAVLHADDVKTLSKALFAKIDTMGSPRLVEYWEQDPCGPSRDEAVRLAMNSGVMGVSYEMISGFDESSVHVEDRFAVGEYAIEILSASDSAGLDRWLHAHGYRIPDAAEPLLRPYVEQGMKWFVARVDASKVHYDERRHAVLSPLRFSYDDDTFTLPVRLGLANSAGTQDLIVNIFAPHQRYEVANYPNVPITTNLDVTDAVKDHFAAFYAALFDRTIQRYPRAVVTEYAWQAMTCDPCPGPQLDGEDLDALGVDGGRMRTTDFVMTRLHARYGTHLPDDLVFREAPPLVGGRELGEEDPDINNFQARYIIRHRWDRPVTCAHPQFGQWGGPPDGDRGFDRASNEPAQAATNLAYADRTFDLDGALDPRRVQHIPPPQTPELALRPRDFALLAIGLGGAILLLRRPRRPRVRSKEST